MKKNILLLLVLLLLIFIIGYSNNQTFKDVTSLLNLSYNNTNNDNNSPIFSFNENGNYTGFSNMPKYYSIQDAKDDGCFVTQDLEVVANENVWNKFTQSSLRKENTGVRIVQFYNDSVEGPFILDLFYNDGYYYLFDSSSENQEKQPYLHLLILEGKYGNPKRDSGTIVLANDDTLTFDMVMKALTSSSSVVINSIPQFKIVMFK